MARLTQDQITQLGTIMSIWAHPDDESYSCAGIMCAAQLNGQTVACVTATKGEAGVQDESRWPTDKLGDIREAEMAAALRVLGIGNHHWLGYRDGQCQEVSEHDAIKQLKGLITQYQPDTIFTFGPEGMTGHPDHQAISKWVSMVTQQSEIAVYHAVLLKSQYEHFKSADQQFNIFFNIDEPPLVAEAQADILFTLPEECLAKKCSALKAMPSQTEALFTTMGEEAVCKMIQTEVFVRAE